MVPPWTAGLPGRGHGGESTASAKRPDAEPRPAASQSASGDELTRQIRLRLRQLLLLVNEFLARCKSGLELRRLTPLVKSIGDEAADLFVLGVLLRGERGLMSPVHKLCVSDLSRFSLALHRNRPLGKLEVVHAMDDLIVQCVLLDTE